MHEQRQEWITNNFFLNHLRIISEECPNKILLHYKGQDFSYRELEAIQDKLIDLIQQLDNSTLPIAIEIERSPAYYAAVLAALRLRRPFISIDSRYSIDLKRHIFTQTNASILVKSINNYNAQVYSLETSVLGNIQAENERFKDIFAIFYTSGSTNVTKGVKLSYSAVENRFTWMWKNFPYHESEKQLFKANTIFIDSLWECLGAFLKAIPTFIAENDLVQEPEELLAACSNHHVTRITVVPSYLKAILDVNDTLEVLASRVASIKYWIVSGERFEKYLAKRLFNLSPSSKILNLYGSTEVMGDVTFHLVTDRSFIYESIPIGQKISQNEVVLVDENNKLITQVGSQGVIIVSGKHVTPGYVDSEKDQDTFINMNVDGIEKRWYITGDQGVLSEKGVIVYVGRKDRQVKINGIRVNLDTLELTMRQHPIVFDVAVFNSEEGKIFICVVLKTITFSHGIEAELKMHLDSKYLGPSVSYSLVILKELIKTISGKINYIALRQELSKKTSFEHNNNCDSQEMLALIEITKKILSVPTITPEDNLFNNGLHSLNAIQLAATIRKTFKKNIKIKEIFNEPTIRGIHERLFADSNI